METVRVMSAGGKREPSVPNEALGRLVGRRLNAVVFSMDIVMLWFDGDEGTTRNISLNCDYPPTVERESSRWRNGDLGYADALRRFIPEVVTGTLEETGTGLVVTFASGQIVVHPEPEENWGFEIASLNGFAGGDVMIWRPGEASFEDVLYDPGR